MPSRHIPPHHRGHVWDVVCRLWGHLNGSIEPDDEMPHLIFQIRLNHYPFERLTTNSEGVVHALLELMLCIKEYRLLTISFQEHIRRAKKQEKVNFNCDVSLNKSRHSVCRVAYHRWVLYERQQPNGMLHLARFESYMRSLHCRVQTSHYIQSIDSCNLLNFDCI